METPIIGHIHYLWASCRTDLKNINVDTDTAISTFRNNIFGRSTMELSSASKEFIKEYEKTINNMRKNGNEQKLFSEYLKNNGQYQYAELVDKNLSINQKAFAKYLEAVGKKQGKNLFEIRKQQLTKISKLRYTQYHTLSRKSIATINTVVDSINGVLRSLRKKDLADAYAAEKQKFQDMKKEVDSFIKKINKANAFKNRKWLQQQDKDLLLSKEDTENNKTMIEQMNNLIDRLNQEVAKTNRANIAGELGELAAMFYAEETQKAQKAVGEEVIKSIKKTGQTPVGGFKVDVKQIFGSDITGQGIAGGVYQKSSQAKRDVELTILGDNGVENKIGISVKNYSSFGYQIVSGMQLGNLLSQVISAGNNNNNIAIIQHWLNYFVAHKESESIKYEEGLTDETYLDIHKTVQYEMALIAATDAMRENSSAQYLLFNNSSTREIKIISFQELFVKLSQQLEILENSLRFKQDNDHGIADIAKIRETFWWPIINSDAVKNDETGTERNRLIKSALFNFPVTLHTRSIKKLLFPD